MDCIQPGFKFLSFCFFPDVLSFSFLHSTTILLSSILVQRDTISHIVMGYKLTEKEMCTTLSHFVKLHLIQKAENYYRSSFAKKWGRDLWYSAFWRFFLKRLLKLHAYVFNFFSSSVSSLSMAGCITNSTFNSISMSSSKHFLLQLTDAFF